eukprot:IDg20197t1
MRCRRSAHYNAKSAASARNTQRRSSSKEEERACVNGFPSPSKENDMHIPFGWCCPNIHKRPGGARGAQHSSSTRIVLHMCTILLLLNVTMKAKRSSCQVGSRCDAQSAAFGHANTVGVHRRVSDISCIRL